MNGVDLVEAIIYTWTVYYDIGHRGSR